MVSGMWDRMGEDELNHSHPGLVIIPTKLISLGHVAQQHGPFTAKAVKQKSYEESPGSPRTFGTWLRRREIVEKYHIKANIVTSTYKWSNVFKKWEKIFMDGTGWRKQIKRRELFPASSGQCVEREKFDIDIRFPTRAMGTFWPNIFQFPGDLRTGAYELHTGGESTEMVWSAH